MRRIATLIILLGLGAVSLMAGDTTNAQPTSDQNAVAAADQAKPAAEAKPAPRKVLQSTAGETGGYLFKSLFGEGLYKKTGIVVENYVQIACQTSNTADKTAANLGNSTWPISGVSDSGCSMYDLDIAIHRDLVSNIAPRQGPVPGPMPKGFSWGFLTSAFYGRNGVSANMIGFDKWWGVNDPGSYNASLGSANRQNFLATPNANVQLYIPLLMGMEVSAGRYGPGIGTEIPPQVRPGPNFFMTRTYTMVALPTSLFGVTLSANVMRNQKLGYLLAEFGVNNGWNTYRTPSGKKDMAAYLTYRTPKMATGVKFATLFGPENITPSVPCPALTDCGSTLPGGTGAAPAAAVGLPASWGTNTLFYGKYNVISPYQQDRIRAVVSYYHNFGKKWRYYGDISYGKYFANAHNTVNTTFFQYGPNHYQAGFNGAKQWSIWNAVTYQYSPKWSFGIRGEHFNNRDGLALYPVCAYFGNAAPGGAGMNCKTDINDVSIAAHYDINKFVQIGPELRYDWQSNAAPLQDMVSGKLYGGTLNIFGVNNVDSSAATATAANGLLANNNKAHNAQLTATLNLMIYF